MSFEIILALPFPLEEEDTLLFTHTEEMLKLGGGHSVGHTGLRGLLNATFGGAQEVNWHHACYQSTLRICCLSSQVLLD